MTGPIQQHALVVYFALAYAFSRTMVALIPTSFVFALLALFGPALAAVLVTSAVEGRRGGTVLLQRLTLWRVGPAWYVLAIGVLLLDGLETRGNVPMWFAFGDATEHRSDPGLPHR